ncbi:uncharacterized protein TRIADDRAFT_59799 [Trichoplax adhaerens]|uniref:RING-type domain-containing protein n=1 Tax=Trichoplax adhaerens TaxID=10228 RepID=B3S6G7_TRIAD|nr:hypothetical protein TRIADDRAFT_59799 [Trichoplax adhaerens]EDV21617.1 hypothetical protein TRIADDRAFT_59799 [Trichoplax adhaerens]|eukprot:XP_002115765.1 hypothetical protein TRIADDRAFT_59799 [Trichoplax adhaerens]
MRIALPESGLLSQAKIECDWKLKNILSNYKQVIQQKLEKAANLIQFMKEFKNLLEESYKVKLGTTSGIDDAFSLSFKEILPQLDDIGWENVDNIDDLFTSIRLVKRDLKSRHHYINTRFLQEEEICTPVFTTDLPIPLHLPKAKYQSLKFSIKESYHYFCEAIELCQAFFDVMDEIDKNTWVLEPQKASRASKERRFCLGKNISVQIDVNPYYPSTIPQYRFFGTDHNVSLLKQKLNNNLQLWNERKSLLTNLQKILEISIPSPTNSQKEEFITPCGICCGYRLNATLPDKVCDYSLCEKQFHSLCLLEWLKTLPSSRTSFSVIHGQCPYCKKPLNHYKLGSNCGYEFCDVNGLLGIGMVYKIQQH